MAKLLSGALGRGVKVPLLYLAPCHLLLPDGDNRAVCVSENHINILRVQFKKLAKYALWQSSLPKLTFSSVY